MYDKRVEMTDFIAWERVIPWNKIPRGTGETSKESILDEFVLGRRVE